MFFDDLGKGWRLGSAVSKIVYSDKKLLVYPLMASLIVTVLVFIVFAGFAVGSGSNSELSAILLLIAIYVIAGTVTFYFDIAMLIEFRGDSNNKSVGIRSALKGALEYIPYVTAWAIVYAIILVVLDYVESLVRRYGGAGAGFIFDIFAGLAVGTATLFVIPAIFEEKVGPFDAIKESVDIVKKRFGQTFGGFAFIEIYTTIISIAGVFIIVFALVFLWNAGLLGLAVFILGIVVASFATILNITFRTIFSLIIYDYVNGKPLPQGLDKAMLDEALKRSDRGGGPEGGGGASMYPNDISEDYVEEDVSKIMGRGDF